MQVYACIYMYLHFYAKTAKKIHLRSFSDPYLSVLAKPKAKAKAATTKAVPKAKAKAKAAARAWPYRGPS